MKTKSNANTPPLEDLYVYFKNINSSAHAEDFDLDETTFNIHDTDEILNIRISEFEMSSSIRGLKPGKSAGYDEILNEYIKCTQNIFMPLYIKLFNFIFETGFIPDTWLEGKI